MFSTAVFLIRFARAISHKRKMTVFLKWYKATAIMDAFHFINLDFSASLGSMCSKHLCEKESLHAVITRSLWIPLFSLAVNLFPLLRK